jgi:hypothetical protein
MMRAPRRSIVPLASRWRWIAVLRAWRPPRSALIAVGVVAVFLIAAIASASAIVRARVSREAERRKLEVDVGSVRLGFFAITLRDVRVRPRGMSGLEARLDEVRLDLGATLALEGASVQGGAITATGEPDELAEKLRTLRRSDDQPPKEAAPKHPHVAVTAEGLSANWKLPSGGELSASGLSASREADAIRVKCAKCEAKHHSVAVVATGAEAELGVDGAPKKVTVATVDVSHEMPPAMPAPPPTSPASDFVPPPLPFASTKKGKAVPALAPVVASEPVLPLPDLHALRTRIATAVAALAPRLPEGASVEVSGLSLKLEGGKEPLAFGPGAFSLARREGRIHLVFASIDAPATGPSGTPLEIDADLPIAAGDITARLAGGPVSLAALGVHEGMKGLTNVSRGMVSGKGQLVLAADAEALTFDAQVALRSLSLTEPRIAPEPIRGIDFSVSARGVLEAGSRLRVDDAQLDMGALHVKTHGTVEETRDHFGVSLAMDVAPAACQAILDSTPQGLLPTVRPVRMSGVFGASVNLAFDTRTIEKLALDYKVGDQCRLVEVPRDLAREKFDGAFSYRIYHPDGTTEDATTGPGTSSWTGLENISPFMIAAVLTTEDGAFYKHKGFNHAAIRSSVQANLKARRFVRGASTISMQLAKNLFLARDKALSRKIEEVILTDYLEQMLRKDDMMELYLNVVEFGPDVYGITQAADYYFGRRPDELNLAECFFLASLLPSPIRYGKMRDRGELPEGWMRHLRALMEIGARNGKIAAAELEEGLKEPVVFVRAGDPRPEPRKPVSTKGREPLEDSNEWRPVQ